MRIFCLLLLFLSIAARGAEQKRYVYLLSRPLESEVQLGPVAESLHYGLEVGLHTATSVGTYFGTGSLTGAICYFCGQMAKTPPMVNWQSMMDLEVRAQWALGKELKDFQKLAKWPGFSNLVVVNTKEIENKVFLAQRQKNKGFVFVETTEPIPDDLLKEWRNKYWRTNWGEPVQIRNPDETFLKLNLVKGQNKSPIDWKISLADLLNPNHDRLFGHEMMPDDIRELWRNDIYFYSHERQFKEPFAHQSIFTSDSKDRWILSRDLQSPVNFDGLKHNVGVVYDRYFRESWLDDVGLEASLVWKDGQIPLGTAARATGVLDAVGKGNIFTKIANAVLFGTSDVGYIRVNGGDGKNFGFCANFYEKLRPVQIKVKKELRQIEIPPPPL